MFFLKAIVRHSGMRLCVLGITDDHLAGVLSGEKVIAMEGLSGSFLLGADMFTIMRADSAAALRDRLSILELDNVVVSDLSQVSIPDLIQAKWDPEAS